MRCTVVARRLQLYIDKRLSLRDVRELEQHLSTCATCQYELFLLETVAQTLQSVDPVVEPPDLTANIMRRIALSPQRAEKVPFSLLRPSLSELVTVVVLASIATFGFILSQPALLETLPIVDGHSRLSPLFFSLLHMLINVNSNTLMLGCWIVGAILGIWITLALAGNAVRRTEWFKSVIERLPVW